MKKTALKPQTLAPQKATAKLPTSRSASKSPRGEKKEIKPTLPRKSSKNKRALSRESPPGKNISNKLKAQLAAPPLALRETGQPLAQVTLELGLLLDATASMSSWIKRAKETLLDIIDSVHNECKSEGETFNIRVCFIGYRDIRTYEGRFEVMPFTEDVLKVKEFISSVKAAGGEDGPEDVQGGLKICLM